MVLATAASFAVILDTRYYQTEAIECNACNAFYGCDEMKAIVTVLIPVGAG